MKTGMNRKIALLLGILMLTLSFVGCREARIPPPAPESSVVSTEALVSEVSAIELYTVTFDLGGGTLLSGELVQTVEEGGAAIAPEAENGKLQLSWDKDFSHVVSDLTVTALWEKIELQSTEVAEIVQKGTVTVNCDYIGGGSGSGSGFFIDNEGTVVTCYHVISFADAINVEVPGGGRYDVQKIVAYDAALDLAILKIDIAESPVLIIAADEPLVGETVYANGSALGTLDGTFTKGTVSSVSRTIRNADCIQMDTAISSGNSGGPLVNQYGEVVGVNAMTNAGGESLNFAIKIKHLSDLVNEVNYSVRDFEEATMKEADRSYTLYDIEDTESLYYSHINTYTSITGRACLNSVDFDGNYYDGYVVDQYAYTYEKNEEELDQYIAYLKNNGYEYSFREEYYGQVYYYYINEWEGMGVGITHDYADYVYITAFAYF